MRGTLAKKASGTALWGGDAAWTGKKEPSGSSVWGSTRGSIWTRGRMTPRASAGPGERPSREREGGFLSSCHGHRRNHPPPPAPPAIPAATAPGATTEAAAARSAGFHGAGFVDHQITAAEVLAMHALDRGLRLCVAAHFDQTQTLGAAGVALHHALGAADRAVLAEGLLQVFVAKGIGQIAHVKFVAHEGLLKKHENAMEPDAINKPVTTSKTRD